MELAPWRPFEREIALLRKERDRLWDLFFGETPFARRFPEEWSPLVDILEKDDCYIVKAELPGLESKDVDVSISGYLLTIRGEKKMEEQDKGQDPYRAERHYGLFHRTLELPDSVQDDKVEATFNKGILNITLPKAKGAKRKRIEIQIK